MAIDNARLYEESRLRERWLRASAEITRSLMSGSEGGEVLRLIAERAREITAAALAVVVVPMENTDSLTELAIGEGAEAHRGLVLPVDAGLMGRAFSEALTNVARHAHAGRTEVVLETDGRELCLTVSDNGVGIPPDGRRSGLHNMAEWARQLQGQGQLQGRLELGTPAAEAARWSGGYRWGSARRIDPAAHQPPPHP